MNEEIVYQETYYDEDGDLVTQTIKKITYPSTRAGENERVTYVNEKSYVDFTAAFYATFSYNIQNKEVSCVSKYITYENKDSNKKFIPDKEVWSDTSVPPIYGCNGFGILMLPSSLILFSKNAISIRGGATTVLFNVCAK